MLVASHLLTYLLTSWTAARRVCVAQDDVWGNAVLLKEANAISVELKKKVEEKFCRFEIGDVTCVFVCK